MNASCCTPRLAGAPLRACALRLEVAPASGTSSARHDGARSKGYCGGHRGVPSPSNRVPELLISTAAMTPESRLTSNTLCARPSSASHLSANSELIVVEFILPANWPTAKVLLQDCKKG